MSAVREELIGLVAHDYSDTYNPDEDFDRHYTVATAQRICARIRPGQRILELGCATGLMTSLFAAAAEAVEVTAVDRSTRYLDVARARGSAGIRYVEGDLDDLPELHGPFDHVVATNVLHELRDPKAFLASCASLLGGDGLLHLSLQNPSSIHRLVAEEMGLIASIYEVSDRGRQWGTARLWSADELSDLAAGAGLLTAAREGVLLKPLPNALMAELPDDVISGFIKVAHRLPELCAMNYLVLRRG